MKKASRKMKYVNENHVYFTSVLGHRLYYSGKDMKNNRYLPRDKKGRFISKKKLKCPKCNRQITENGHDPCLANLPGVDYACCGHGTVEGYITFKNGITIRGNFKVEK